MLTVSFPCDPDAILSDASGLQCTRQATALYQTRKERSVFSIILCLPRAIDALIEYDPAMNRRVNSPWFLAVNVLTAQLMSSMKITTKLGRAHASRLKATAVSSEDFLDQFSMHIGQAIVASLVPVR